MSTGALDGLLRVLREGREGQGYNADELRRGLIVAMVDQWPAPVLAAVLMAAVERLHEQGSTT